MLIWDWRMSIWLKTINVAIVEQRPTAVYVISDDFSSYDDRRLLVRILILLLLNKSYQLILNRTISIIILFNTQIVILIKIRNKQISNNKNYNFMLFDEFRLKFSKKNLYILQTHKLIVVQIWNIIN